MYIQIYKYKNMYIPINERNAYIGTWEPDLAEIIWSSPLNNHHKLVLLKFLLLTKYIAGLVNYFLDFFKVDVLVFLFLKSLKIIYTIKS